MADVHFELGDSDDLIPAHKFVLSVGSCVFEAMFQRNTDSSIIHVPDMETYAFRTLLRFLYGDSNYPLSTITHDTVMSILYGAKKYCVLGLERLCVDFLKKNISIENALILLSQARLFDEAQLAAQCLEVIDKNAMYALQTPELLDIDLDTLMAILKRDTLGVREIKLWQTCLDWARNKCKNHHHHHHHHHHQTSPTTTPDMIRQTLGGALKLIRFPLMSQEEFAQGPAQSGVLTDKEVISIFLYFNLPAKTYKFCEFDDEPRSTFKEYAINRFRQGEVEHRWSYSDAFDRIRFKCDRRLFIAGYGLYGSIREPFEYNVHIQVENNRRCFLLTFVLLPLFVQCLVASS
jgi:BTB/POZ domain-containing protein 1/2